MVPSLTLIEKLATKHADGMKSGQVVRSGDFITIRPKHIMTHDNTSAVMSKFKEIWKGIEATKRRSDGATQGLAPVVHDPRQPVVAIDHDIQNTTPENLGKYAKIEAFARENGIDYYPPGTGICHQVMVEQGYVVPGSMVVGSDSHSNLYGSACCLGTPVVRTDAASLWATGVTWWQVPPVARCLLKGKLQPGVVGKDVIIALCGLFNKDEVLNMAVEFVGDEIAALPMDQRMTIANMTTEWGALVGIFPFDETLRDYLYSRADYFGRGRRPGTRRSDSLGTYARADVDEWWNGRKHLQPDPGAAYAIELELDLSTVIPHVSGPNTVKTMVPLPEIEKQRMKINKAWLMSCVNARYEDIAEAAGIVRDKKVAAGVEFYLAAASAEVQQRATRDGHWKALVDAGAIELPPGCGTCIGLGRGTIKAGEVGISATNRNFEGRMGDREGLVYLGSPAVVAASAIAGYICSPTPFNQTNGQIKIRRPTAKPQQRAAASIMKGFPERVSGRALWLQRDNLNTDGIYSGKLTYRDDVTPAEMAAASFNNYDPNFIKVARAGDIVISGRNFGTGSSREQAATCLKHFGIPCVIAYSFSETYKRNAFNNGFVVFECPEFVEHFETGGTGLTPAQSKKRTGETPVPPALTVIGPEIEIDYKRSVITCERQKFPFPALSVVAQELVVAGGAENVVKRRLAARSEPVPST
ncbi:MAG: homoaconitase [Phycisphaerales bacterium]|nr:homoaconitase [Phycisphaerales bacterium]